MASFNWSPDDTQIVFEGRGLVSYDFTSGLFATLAKDGRWPDAIR